MKFTAFNEIHKKAGAKMLEFAGYEMPIEYSGIIDEHNTVRNAVGVFDVSHMGEFWVKGPNALESCKKINIKRPNSIITGSGTVHLFS
jgi:aminomethyltransferase